MFWRATALSRQMTGGATPIPAAGPVPPEPTTSIGRSSFVGGLSRLPPAPIQQPLSSALAAPTKSAPKRGNGKQTVLAALQLRAGGSSSLTPAHQRQPPAKQVLNLSSLPVLLTPVGQSQEPERVLAPTPTDNLSGSLGKNKTLVCQTRPPAKRQWRAGRKAACKTKAVSKNLRAKAPAQIRMDSPSLVDGR